MNAHIFSTTLLMIASLSASASGTDGLRVDYLGPANTLVRVEKEAPLLILPIQESASDARINILVDGKLDRTLFVRLARSGTDYTVPLDLSSYKGHSVVLDVVSDHDRASGRDPKSDICWNSIALADSFDSSNREKYRPAFHHSPLYGWMNDPNGMFFKDGAWHIYYQWNPFGSKWQNMTWGHSSSTDLMHWTHHSAAIQPDGLGTIFSGSAVVDHEGSAGFGNDRVIALYTSAGTSQVQSLAHSVDNGMTFSKYTGNPVLTLDSEARDPNMFWNSSTAEWNLVLAHALDKEILFFSSPDLKKWTLMSAFGKGIGAQDGVWECPDLFELPVDGSDMKKWVLIVNINPGGPFGGSATQYFIGDYDGHTFTPDRDADGKIPVKWMDFGKDHYATVSWSNAPDGRRTAIGWMSNWQYAADVPTMQFRSANTLPRELSLFYATDGKIYLASSPVPETSTLRARSLLKGKSFNSGKKAKTFSLPSNNDGICEIAFDFNADAPFSLELSNKAGEKVVITYDAATESVAFDRTQAGISDFSTDFPTVTVAPVFAVDGSASLHLFIDRASIELFGRDGRFAMTNLVFPSEPYSCLSFSSPVRNHISNLEIHSLKDLTGK